MTDSFFQTVDQQFSIISHGVTLSVKKYNIPGYIAFLVEFSSERKPITIVQGIDRRNQFFWTAIPEGQNREGEARGVGKLIEEYLQS